MAFSSRHASPPVSSGSSRALSAALNSAAAFSAAAGAGGSAVNPSRSSGKAQLALAAGQQNGAQNGKKGARVIHTLRNAVDQLRRDSEEQLAAEQEAASTVHYLCAQVAALQRGFTILSDAVLEELDAVRDESARWASEREGWASRMAALEGDVLRRVSDTERWRNEVETRVAQACADANNAKQHADATRNHLADVEGTTKALVERVSALENEVGYAQQALGDTRHKVSDLDGRTAEIGRRSAAVQAAAEAADARLQAALDSLRRESSDATAALARDAAALAEDARSMRQWSKNFEVAHDARLKRLETAQPAMVANTEGLNERLQSVAAQQARQAKSMEEIIKGLMTDTASLAKRQRESEGLLDSLRRTAGEQHDALIKSSQVFAEALAIPAPVTSSQAVAAPPSAIATFPGY